MERTKQSKMQARLELQQAFGNNIKLYRQKAGLTMKELGKAIGLSQHMINSLEMGIRATGLENTLLLCQILIITPNELLPKLPKKVANNHHKL